MKYYLAGLLSICLVSCQEPNQQIELMQDKERVVDILADMYIAESALNKQSVIVRDSLTSVYRDNIILIHDLTEVEFDTLFWLIQKDMDNYGDIHRKVVEKLKVLNSSVEKK